MKKSIPPPQCEEGDILKARLIEIKKVTSQWKDDKTGELKEQFEIDFELENGSKGRTWMAYYEAPGDRSALGALALTLQRMTKREIDDIQGFLSEFKAYGKFFVRCKGFRETEGGDEYPNFSIVTDKLPTTQEKLSVHKKEPERATPIEVTEEKNIKNILEGFKDIITLGVPLSLNDLGNSVPVTDRIALFKEGLIEQKEDLYFFTDKAKEILKNAL